MPADPNADGADHVFADVKFRRVAVAAWLRPGGPAR